MGSKKEKYDSIFKLDGLSEISQAFLRALQHVVAIIVGVAVILQPCFIKAEEITYSNGMSSSIWLDDTTIPVGIIGEYQYLWSTNCFRFYFSGTYGKSEDFFILKDTILGRPVTSVDYQSENKNNNFYFPGIYIPDSVTQLGFRSFNLLQFPHIYLSNSVKTIPKRCFWGNEKLEQLILPSNLKIIREQAFAGCTKLNYIKIPNKVKSILKSAFEDCKNLTKLYLPASVTTIEKDVFKNCKQLTIYCEKNSYAYNYAKKNKIKTKLVSNKKIKAKQITNVPSSINVGTQEAYLLFPFIEPFYATNQKLVYMSDDPSIAEVNQNGKVEGKKKGTTTITVMTTDGSHLQKKVKVTVKQGKTMMNPYFSLFQIKKGNIYYNTDAMLYNRNPNATYQLKSSNSSIAIAKELGDIVKVTAKKSGIAVFVVTEINGNTKKELGSFPISVIDN